MEHKPRLVSIGNVEMHNSNNSQGIGPFTIIDELFKCSMYTMVLLPLKLK